MTKKTKLKPSKELTKPKKAIVLFGVDEAGKPRAARFIDDDEALVAKAAQLMGLRLGIATQVKEFEVVDQLPLGRLYAAGKGFVPNVRQDLYDKLNILVGGEPGPVPITLPKTWDELAPGHLVIAHESARLGWWEAVVIKREAEMLTLKWRDYPDQGELSRHIKSVALLATDTP